VACETSIRTHRSPSRSSNKRQTAFFSSPFYSSPLTNKFSKNSFAPILQKKTCQVTNWRGQRGAPSFSRQKRNPELARKNAMVGTRTQRQQDEPQGSNPSEASQMVSIEALMKLIERIHPAKPTEPPILPEFSGLDHEDPKAFLEECKAKLANTDATLWREKVAARFRDAAAEWWGFNAPFARSFQDLERVLLSKYDSPAIKQKLISEFHGTKQADGESAVSFLAKKRLLSSRIYPDMTDEELTKLCRLLLNDELIKYSAFAPPRSMEDLIAGATEIEAILSKEKTTKPATPQALPRCSYCPERHFHRDCPELQRLRDASGNGRGAGFARGPNRETAGPSQ
jgi:hypothetical protein